MTYAGLLRKALPPPVFVDLVWERHRSPLVAALTTLRFLGFMHTRGNRRTAGITL